MSLLPSFGSPARFAAVVLAGVSRRLASAASGWCPAPRELDDHLLRDIGRDRGEVNGLTGRRGDEQ